MIRCNPVLHSTLDQLRTQEISKHCGDALSYLDADALLDYEKKRAKSGRVALMAMAMVPVLVAVAVAVTLSR